MKERLFSLAISPHISSGETTAKIMWSVIIALLPASFAGIYLFGIHTFYIILTGVIAAISTEGLFQFVTRRKIRIFDGSAVVTGMLLALILPPAVPLWIPALGSFFAIFLAKELFGGLGHNIFNPALAGRAILLASFPLMMTSWVSPFDAISCATPLAIVKDNLISTPLPSYFNLFVGTRAGCLGETSVLALLAGSIFLFLRRIISWQIPVTFIATVGLFSFCSGKDPLLQILSGGLILGAFFMATDYTTSPITKKGQIIFGLGCGAITSLIRFWGGYPEGVCYAILFMNCLVPLIDKHTLPKRFGEKGVRSQHLTK
ncbi:MAG: RnfABCDGE type electron transport complex subunit D [Candidatus Omnitrophica bacterium]|nr:RnfABCDGE type electron transport complex subunit D [Candidatus Omnitrophota bacterium]